MKQPEKKTENEIEARILQWLGADMASNSEGCSDKKLKLGL